MRTKIRDAIHLAICFLCILIASTLKQSMSAAGAKTFVETLSALVGILAAVEIFIKKETKYSTLFFVVDAILVVALIGTAVSGGVLDAVAPFICVAVMLIYALYPITYYFGRVYGALKGHKAGIPIAFAVLATKVLSIAVGIGIYQYFQDAKSGGDPSGSNGYFNLLKISGIIILVVGVLGLLLTILEHRKPSLGRHKGGGYTPKSSGSSGSSQVDSITYKIASSFSKTYYEGHAIVTLKVNRRISGSDIYFVVSGSARSAEPLTSQALADLYQRDTETCLNNAMDDILAAAERALNNVDGLYYIHVDSNGVRLN